VLRGLSSDAVCPECGCPVAESLRGDLLQFSSRDYVLQVFRGHKIVLAGLLVWVINLFVSALLHQLATKVTSGWQAVATIFIDGIGIALSILLFYGHLKITTPDPQYQGEQRPDRSRAWVRGAAIAMILGSLFSAIYEYALTGVRVVWWIEPLAGSSWILGLIVLFFSMMHYERWLARRVPDAQLISHTRLFEWFLPVISIGLCCVFLVGPITSLVLYWLLLNRMRKHLQSIVHSGLPARLPGVINT
jgi:hypothetical protein